MKPGDVEAVQNSFDISNAELIVTQRRCVNQFCVDLLRVYLVAGSLETLDRSLSIARQEIHKLVSALPKYCIGHCLHRTVFHNIE